MNIYVCIYMAPHALQVHFLVLLIEVIVQVEQLYTGYIEVAASIRMNHRRQRWALVERLYMGGAEMGRVNHRYISVRHPLITHHHYLITTQENPPCTNRPFEGVLSQVWVIYVCGPHTHVHKHTYITVLVIYIYYICMWSTHTYINTRL